MAALTSSQSGNWTSSTTWGGSTPADGDTFTITAGHKVTVNSDNRPTNGYGDITVFGNLHFATNAKFRMNGRITVEGSNQAYATGTQFTEGSSTSGGLLSGTGNNIELEFRGNNDAQHGIWIQNERFASLKFVGDEGRTNSTISSIANIRDEYITVANDSGFAAGDWISIYLDGNQDNRVLGDEGMWIHDVDASNNRLYIRQFVSPTAVITRASGNQIKVDNAKVFRVGYKIIFGTGSNRNVKTITNIGYRNNKITLDSNVTGNVADETVYQTGIEKKHPVGRAVLKMATTLTTAVTANTTNQITVGSANDINVGDTIVVDVNNDTDTNWDYRAHYTVSSKSGNTLTLDTNLEHDRKVGSIVTVLTRKFKIRGVDNSSDTRCFLYVEYWTSFNDAHTRHIHLKNVEFTQWGGNTKSTYYRGTMIAGYNSEYRENESSDERYKFQSRIEGCTWHNMNYNTSYMGLSLRHSHGIAVRNNICYGTGNQAFWMWSSNHNVKFYNNYATRNAYSSFQPDAIYEPYSEYAYLYGTRSDDYGFMCQHHAEAIPIRHVILLHHEQRPMYIYWSQNNNVFDRIYMDGFRQHPYIGDRGSSVIFTDSYAGNKWYKSLDGETNGVVSSTSYWCSSGASSRNHYQRNAGHNQKSTWYDLQFEIGKMMVSHQDGMVLTDSIAGTKHLYGLGTTDDPAFIDSMYIPAGTTVRLKCRMEGENNSNYTFPHLFGRKLMNGYNGGRYQTAYTDQTSFKTSSDSDVINSPHLGFSDRVQFTSAMRGATEEAHLTITAQNYSYMLVYGITLNSNAHQERFKFETVDVLFDKSPKGITHSPTGNKIKVRNSFTEQKKRISGRL